MSDDITLPDGVAVALGNLFAAFGSELKVERGRMYYRALHDIPERLITAAVGWSIKTRVFLPKPAELRADAAACRGAILNAIGPFKAPHDCACNGTGWIEDDIDGVRRALRCACYQAYHRRLDDLGITPSATLALRAPDVPRLESEFDPRMAQIAANDR